MNNQYIDDLLGHVNVFDINVSLFFSFMFYILPLLGVIISVFCDRMRVSQGKEYKMQWMAWIPRGFAWVAGMMVSVNFLLSSIQGYKLADLNGASTVMPLFTQILAGLMIVLGVSLFIPLMRDRWMNLFNLDKARDLHKFLLFMTYFCAAFLFQGIYMSSAGISVTPREDLLLGIAKGFIFILLALLSVGWLVSRDFNKTIDRFGLRTFNGRGVLIGSVLGFSSIAALFLLHVGTGLFQGLFSPNLWGDVATAELASGTAGWVVILIVGLLGVFGSELFFRCVIQPRFGGMVTAVLSVILCSGLAILGWMPLLLAFAFGYALGTVSQWYGVWAAISMHMAAWVAYVFIYMNILGLF